MNLRETIAHHQALYDAGMPEISDEEFDRLVARLRAEEGGRVPLPLGTISAKRGTVQHQERVLSLDKTYSVESVHQWASSFYSAIIIQPKYDGMTAVLRYGPDGKLASAATRGDGAIGEDITVNANSVRGVQTTFLPGAEVRGEILISKADFQKHFATEFKNPRNFVAGTMRDRKAPLRKLQGLRFIAYDLRGTRHRDDVLALGALEQYGFTTPKQRVVLKTADVLLALRDLTDYVRNDCPYECDGLVCKATDYAVRADMGVTEHHPRWALARKFQGESGVTRVIDAQWQVSRTGTITPVLFVAPVNLSGATVRKATLHTAARFVAMELSEGDEITMTRRGGVIPHVEGIVRSNGGKLLFVPAQCPSCDSPTKWSGEFLVCSKPATCTDVLTRKVVHWCSVLGVDGMGETTARQLLLFRSVTDPSHLYDLEGRKAWPGIIGEGVARNLITELDAKRVLPLGKFIQALGIEGVGNTASRLMDRFDDIEDLLDWAGFIAPASLSKRDAQLALGVLDNRPLISALLDGGVELARPVVPSSASGPFVGKSVVFTGALSDMDRESARALVRQHGGTTPDGVTKTLDILVIGDGARDEQRGKRDKAEKANAKGAHIAIWSEDDWVKALIAVGGV